MKFLNEPVNPLPMIDVVFNTPPECLPICYCWTYMCIPVQGW